MTAVKPAIQCGAIDSITEERAAPRRGASPTKARAWLELQAKEIAAMGFFLDDGGYTATQLDEFRRRLTEGDLSESAPPAPESLPAERDPV